MNPPTHPAPSFPAPESQDQPQATTPAPPTEFDSLSDCLDALNERERRFVLAYVGPCLGNGTEAARLAGYEGDRDSLRVYASTLLARPRLRSAIRAYHAPRILQADEILGILHEHATADLSRIEECYVVEVVRDLDGEPVTKADGEPVTRRVIDWAKVRELGLGRLIKGVRPTKHGDELILHDSQRAAEILAKWRGLLVDRVHVSRDDLEQLPDDELERLAKGAR